MVNLIESSFYDLKRINMEREISNSTIVSMIEERLSKTIKMQWCLEVCNINSAVDDRDKFPKLLQFLLTQKRAVEYSANDLRSGILHKQGTAHMAQGSVNRPKLVRENCWIHKDLDGAAGQHPIWKCRLFISKTVNERTALVKANNACYACLLTGCPGAVSPDRCVNQIKCREVGCGKRHNQLLHAMTLNATGLTNHAMDSHTDPATLSNLADTPILPLQTA